MRFECESCGHLGEAAQIKPAAAGVELVCASCGHASILGATASPVAPPAAGVERADPRRLIASVLSGAEGAAAGAHLPDGALDPVEVLKARGVRIDPGQGDVRCPKCGYRQGSAGSCRQCGVDLSRSDLQGIFDRPPEGKEADAELLDARWEALSRPGGGLLDAGERESFIRLASELGLLDRASRRFRFHAPDHAGSEQGEAAADALSRLVERMHAEFVSAHGASSRDQYTEGARQIRMGLYALAVVMCLLVAALAAWIFL